MTLSHTAHRSFGCSDSPQRTPGQGFERFPTQRTYSMLRSLSVHYGNGSATVQKSVWIYCSDCSCMTRRSGSAQMRHWHILTSQSRRSPHTQIRSAAFLPWQQARSDAMHRPTLHRDLPTRSSPINWRWISNMYFVPIPVRLVSNENLRVLLLPIRPLSLHISIAPCLPFQD